MFDHVGIYVLDLDRAVGWYRDALELSVDFEFALPKSQLRGAMLLSPTGYRIELLERQGSGAGVERTDPLQAALTRGLGHICLDVENVGSAYTQLIAAGAADRMSPRPSPEPGVHMAFVADPEGNLIELLDRASVRARGGYLGSTVAHIPMAGAEWPSSDAGSRAANR